MNIQLPNFEFLRFGNKYSGSFGDFNYKVEPKVGVNSFDLYVWVGCDCLEFSLDCAEKAEFELSEKGLELAQSWVESKFDELKN